MAFEDFQTNDTALDSTGTVATLTNVSGPVTVGLDNVSGLATNPSIALEAQEDGGGGEWIQVHDFGAAQNITFHDTIAAANLRLQIYSAASGGTGDFYIAAGD